MTFRRRPIPKGNYHWKREPKPVNILRYDVILDGAVVRYFDGREVCQENSKGYAEYNRRVEIMLSRQNWRCCLCGERIRSRSDATFEHQRRRGMGAAFRDDRIYNEKGEALNGAAHWACNVEKG